MAEEKEKPKPFFTTEKVTLYAPKGAKFHEHGQKVEVQARQKDKFLKLGYRETPEAAEKATAHPAITAPAPVVGSPAATAPAAVAQTETPAADAGSKEPKTGK